MDQTAMRQVNAAEALGLLYRTGPATMAALQAQSAVSRRTLEVILDELVAQGWVEEIEPPAEGIRPVGRPARRFSFRYDAGYMVAIQLAASGIEVTLANLAADVIAHVKSPIPMSTSRKERLALLDRRIEETLKQAEVDRSAVLAVTVSTPGIVRDNGEVDLPMTMPEWTGFSLSEAVGRLFECPVRVENDAKLGALGEKWNRASDTNDFAYIFSDSDRIGIGLILNDELRRGADGAAGEITWAQGLSLYDLRSPLLDGLDDEASPNHERAVALLEAARSGDPLAMHEVHRVAATIAPTASAIAWLLAPEQIVLGGTLAVAADLLAPALQAALNEGPHASRAEVVGSQFSSNGALAGCLRMCQETLRARLSDAIEQPAPNRAGSAARGAALPGLRT